MLALSFRFLAGRYHATQWGRNVNEGIVDWPPSPWRILRAIIASWKNTSGDLGDDQMWPILQALAQNDALFYLPPTVPSHTRHYMPISGKEKTTKIIDSFLVVSSEKPVVAIWDNVNLDGDQEKTLDCVLGNISYFGRAESWCEIRREQKPPAPNCLRINENTVKNQNIVRVLTATGNATLEDLCVNTAALHKDKKINPPGSQWLQYVLPDDLHVQLPDKPPQTINIVRYSIVSRVRPRITESLSVGGGVRKALMSKYGAQNQHQTSSTISGKDANGLPLRGNHQHAFFFPTDEDCDNIIDHMTIIASTAFDEKEIRALASLKSIWNNQGSFDLVFQGRGKSADFGIPILQKSKKWVSSTPYVLNRHTKIRGGRVIDGPEDQIRFEISKRSISSTIKNIQVYDSKSDMKCGLKPIQFKRWRKDRMSGFGAYNVSIEFDEPVSGPISLGHASHFGLGMFVPLDTSNA